MEGSTMSDNSLADWNPQDESVLFEQRGAYDAMRERCPVAHSEFLGWSLFKHDDIENVLADPETFSSASRYLAIPNGMDEPEHTPYRAALDPYLDAQAMAAFEPRCRRIASDIVKSILDRDTVDIVSDYTEPFSLKSLCALIDWPLNTWEHLRGWSHGNQQAAFSRDRAAGKSLAAEFTGFVMKELDLRREAGAGSGNDLTSSLMNVEVDGKGLSDEGIISILRNWTAGHGTVVAGIGLVIHYLAEHEELQLQLRDDPSGLPAAIDEILRVDGPLVANRRTATRDVEISGRQIAAGDTLTLMWIAANRDDEAFDHAIDVRLDRDPAQNLLFGAGIHHCQGIRLARLEMRMAIEELLAQTNGFHLVEGATPKRDVYPSNGLESMTLRIS